jgi:hypothetical protein
VIAEAINAETKKKGKECGPQSPEVLDIQVGQTPGTIVDWKISNL